jgi:hypothetical protein
MLEGSVAVPRSRRKHVRKFLAVALVAAVSVPAAAAAAPSSRPSAAPTGRVSLDRNPVTKPALLPAAREDALSRALEAGQLSEAEYALERARSLFALRDVRGRLGDVARPDPRSATILLRDLAIRLKELDGADLEAAEALLARPTSRRSANSYRAGTTQYKCDGAVCIHWATSGSDAPPVGGQDTALAIFKQVYDAQIGAMGYRAPKSDMSSPGNQTQGLDIYLQDLGGQGIYGYCTSDDPNLQNQSYPYGDMSAYCAVDNDFSPLQFGNRNTPLQNLQVTAAHEFFHAVQFAYDTFEDPWMMEGTASWIEDELYDDINDNYQYLHASQLTQPDVWLDVYVPPSEGAYMYGTWLFFRYITENINTPGFVREAWALADSSVNGTNRYSVQAIDQTLQAKGSNFRWAYADFAAANYLVDAAYEEGAAYLEEVGGYPPEAIRKLTGSRRKFAGYVDLDHLTSFYVAFRPGKGLPTTSKLRVFVDTPAAIEGGEATVITLFRDGSFQYAPLQMNNEGDGTVITPFKRKRVFQVGVILSNGSIRMDNCFQGTTPFSCFGGTPRDDGTRYTVKVKVMS